MVKIAAIQLSSSDCINDNLVAIEQQLKKAKQRGVALALLPENCAYMSAVQGQNREIAEPIAGGGTVMQRFSQLAQQHDMWLLVGAFPTIDNGVIYQTLLAYNNVGECVAYYHKRHLFDVTLPDESESYRESDAFSHGDAIKVLSTPWGKIGFAICYDLRFPEHFRQLVDAGAQLLVLPAAFTYATGQAHWEVLLRARAVENQCYVLAAGQTGSHPGWRETWGHSMMIDPWGKIVDCIPIGEGMAVGDWDIDELTQQRKVFPALAHRRA